MRDRRRLDEVRTSRGRLQRLLGAILLSFFATAGATPSASETAQPNAAGHCTIEFVGTSTLHDFAGTVDAQPFALERHIDDETGRMWWSGRIEVAVLEMDTGIDKRNHNMHEMLTADLHPRIVADFRRIEDELLAASRAGGASSLTFDLTIRDVTHPVVARISEWVETAEEAGFDATFEVSLSSFGLEAPVVLGLLRVGDVVSVRAHVLLTPPPQAAALRPSPERPREAHDREA